jgi:hypothetical protein
MPATCIKKLSLFTLPLAIQRYIQKYEVIHCDFVLYSSGICPEEYIQYLKVVSAFQLAARDPLTALQFTAFHSVKMC